jgi:peptidyl-prolyl cis-trans isomerase SurA
MRLRRLLAGLLLGSLGLLAAPEQEARASVADRVVAVVGERPILLSELRQRARPHLQRAAAAASDPTQQAAAEVTIFRELLDRMIDDRLEEQAAEKARLSATTEEIDNGIRQVATQTNLTPNAVIAEAIKQGLSEQDYRDEIRRQIIEGKLVQLRVRGRVHVTEQDMRAAYSNWVSDVAKQSPVDVRIMVFQIPAKATAALVAARHAQAAQAVQQVRSGGSFCQVLMTYAPSSNCGSRGLVPISALFPEIARVVATMKPGDVSDPIIFLDPMGNTALLVVQLFSDRAVLPPYEEVKEQMKERALGEATERQRKQWLQELRRRAYIDTRL